ncbi:MAG: GPR endopeptidase [Firmicutes bacterium]|nr:GPR endopeptidase [Bacillota bacterium]
MKEFYGMRRLAGRLGLAREAAAILRGEADVELPGVSEEVRREDGVEVHTVTVLNEEGSRLLGRPPGSYITCTVSSREDGPAAAAVLSRQIGRLLPHIGDGAVLLVGLGNRRAAPDSLGPAVIDRSFATNHAFQNGGSLPGWSRVCTFVPGVLGLTGIETSQAVAGVCSRLRPAAVIAVDSLAAADVSRVGRTVQLSDGGIRPGSGVGGSGGELSEKALGCPVLALGVPTVVDSAAVIGGVLAALKEHWSRSAAAAPPDLDDAAREYTEQRLLEDFHGTLSLTPREIDDLIESMSRVLAAAIALAVHPGCDENNYDSFIK